MGRAEETVQGATESAPLSPRAPDGPALRANGNLRHRRLAWSCHSEIRARAVFSMISPCRLLSLGVLQAALGCVVTLASASFAAAPASRPFEVAASLYAWELHDEGVETILDNLQRMAAVNSVYLIALMHPEPRPHRSERFPHNPTREKLMPEDAALYWQPDAARYGRIRPFVSAQPWLAQTDWLQTLAAAARRRGLRVGVEVSHSLVPEWFLARPENADLLQLDLHGRPAGMYWSARFPCLNHPDVQHFVAATFADLAAGRDMDFVQTCMLLFAQNELPQAGCFCASCARRAKSEGIDFDALVAALRKDPKSAPHEREWRDFRRRAALDTYRRIQTATKAANPRVEFRLNHHSRIGDAWDDELLAAVTPYVDSIRISDYAEQEPHSAERFARKEKWLADTRTIAGPAMPILSAIGVRPEATPRSIGSGIDQAVRLGAQGISLGHYDGAIFSSLRAVRSGLVAARVSGVAPATGHRLADLLNRTRRRATPEAAGVAANDRRRVVRGESGVAAVDTWDARFAFEFAPGRYDVTLTAADLPGGRGVIALEVDGREVGRVALDRDHGAWTVLTLARGLALAPGTQVRLTGTRDAEDWAIADYVEFVPVDRRPGLVP